ncbi:MAG: signal peptidase I [Bdellovibrionota bacterium]
MKLIKRHLSTLALLFFLVGIRSTFANQYVVPTGSMIPTISIGDRILANRVAYDFKFPFTNVILQHIADPQRGDVVVFESPIQPGLVLVKRLIAIGGDHVIMQNGFITLNGKRLDDFDGKNVPYHEALGEHAYTIQRLPQYFRPERREFVVPADQFLMFGDNRDNSADSRVFGFVPRDHLIGRASRVLYSFDFPHVDLARFGKRLD